MYPLVGSSHWKWPDDAVRLTLQQKVLDFDYLTENYTLPHVSLLNLRWGR